MTYLQWQDNICNKRQKKRSIRD